MDFFINFFTNLFKDTPEKRLKRFKKITIKNLNAGKPPVFDRGSEYFSADFAAHLYKIFLPLLSIFNALKIEFREKRGGPLRKYLVDAITTDDQMKILAGLEEENLRKTMLSTDQALFYQQIEAELTSFIASFSAESKEMVNRRYNNLHVLSHLADVDYVSFFKEFDSGFTGENLQYQPNFQSKNSRYFVEDFIKFDNVLQGITLDSVLLEDIRIFQQFRNKEDLDEKNIKESFKLLNAIKTREVFKKIITVIKGDMEYISSPVTYHESIVMTILDKTVGEIRKTITDVFGKMKTTHVESLKTQLFKNETLPPLKAYTDKSIAVFNDLGIEKYKFCAELQLVKMFIVLKYNTEIKSVLNIFVLKGTFNDDGIKAAVNDSYYKLNDFLERVVSFDLDLNEDGKTGQRIKRALLSVHKERRAVEIVDEINKKANEDVKLLIHDFIVTIKMLSTALQTIEKSYNEKNKKILSNIMNFDGPKTAQHIAVLNKICKDIVLFLNILKSAG